MSWKQCQPILHEAGSKAPTFDRHYVYHLAWAARVLAKSHPQKHVDISSYIYFSAIVSAFIPVDYYEYRPMHLRLSNLTTETADVKKLPFPTNSLKSISCLHVLEHIGLGRYGDEIDSDGDLKAISEIKRVLAPKGHLLIAVPLGQPRIVFNANRIYSLKQIKTYFKDLRLQEFVLIPQLPSDGNLVYHPSMALVKKQESGCGCFLFQKK